jgi:hypothetical protein
MGKLKKTALVAGITVLLMGAAAGTTYALLNARTVTILINFFIFPSRALSYKLINC